MIDFRDRKHNPLLRDSCDRKETQNYKKEKKNEIEMKGYQIEKKISILL